MQVVSCGANPFSPRSSHGDSSYYGYCMRCVSGIWSRRKCVSMLFDGSPRGLCRQVGSDGLIPVVADLRSVLALFPPPPLAAEDMKDF